MAEKRKGITKKIRFEVFKRDSFKCQYCGGSAPSVLLRIDHIKPFAKGGKDSTLNYVTACFECNAGKRDRELSDGSVIEKQRLQLEQLQERREQLEMMMEWSQGLADFQNDVVERLARRWHELAPGFQCSAHGKRNLRKWLRKFSLDELLQAMEIAVDQYLVFEKGGKVTDASWNEGFLKIPGICFTTKREKEFPELSELYYIRGILRKRCSYFVDWQCLDLLKQAFRAGASIDWLQRIAKTVNNWSQFRQSIEDYISEHGEKDAK